MDTFNAQMVGVHGDEVVVMMPRRQMTSDEAMMHAAWLVTIAHDAWQQESSEKHQRVIRDLAKVLDLNVIPDSGTAVGLAP